MWEVCFLGPATAASIATVLGLPPLLPKGFLTFRQPRNEYTLYHLWTRWPPPNHCFHHSG